MAGAQDVRRRTHRQALWEVASGDHGLITLDAARDAGVPAVEVRKLAARRAIDRVGHGLYRDPLILATDLDQYAWAVRAVGLDAYLMGDSVLAIHNLALVNPTRITVGTPRRIWRNLPPVVNAVSRTLPPEALTVEDGIAQTTLAQAFADCFETVMSDRLREAITQAGRRGLLTKREQQVLRGRLRRVGS